MAEPTDNHASPNGEMTPEELRAAYAWARSLYTKEELEQMFTTEEEWVPTEQVLAELEEIHRECEEKRKHQ